MSRHSCARSYCGGEELWQSRSFDVNVRSEPFLLREKERIVSRSWAVVGSVVGPLLEAFEDTTGQYSWPREEGLGGGH